MLSMLPRFIQTKILKLYNLPMPSIKTLIIELNKNRKLHTKIFVALAMCASIWMFANYLSRSNFANIFEFLILYSGYWSIGFYALSYVASPLQRFLCFISIKCNWERGKRLSDWNFIRFHRRTFGLISMYFLIMHFLIYFYFELDWMFSEFVYDVKTRHFLFAGFIAFLLMMTLSISSFKSTKKMLKKNWQRIHKLTNLIAILAILHITMASKTYDWYHYLIVISLSVMMLERVFRYFQGYYTSYLARLERN